MKLVEYRRGLGDPHVTGIITPIWEEYDDVSARLVSAREAAKLSSPASGQTIRKYGRGRKQPRRHLYGNNLYDEHIHSAILNCT